MKLRQTIVLSALTALTAVSLSSAVYAAPTVPNRPQTTMTEITTRDFTTFKVPESVKLYHVSFSNQYGMEVVGYLFVPKDLKGKAKAIVIGHPMGASKEQAASNYGAALAEHGFVTLAVDQQFWGESSGYPRHAISPDLYAEAFSAAVDFLGTRNFVNRNKIGILGICGSGSFVISAAKIDPRMKAVATVSMYNIGEMRRSGIRNSVSLEQRKKVIADAQPNSATLISPAEIKSLWAAPRLKLMKNLRRLASIPMLSIVIAANSFLKARSGKRIPVQIRLRT